MSSKPSGFTLIELLFVIAIISIIAGIIYPVYSRTRERGRQATCLSNIRQLGVALQMYTDDWNGCFPASRVDEGGVGNPSGNWAGVSFIFGLCELSKGQVYSYIRNADIYLCPSARGSRPERITVSDALPYPLSYSMNNFLSYKNTGSFRAPLEQVGLLIHEDLSTLDDGDFNWGGWAGHTGGGNSGHNRPGMIHNGGTCIVYCDGHARWKSYAATILDLKNDKWNPDKP